MTKRPRRGWSAALCLAVVGCGGGSSGPAGADLSAFALATIVADGVEFEVYVADDDPKREQGLMGATHAQIAPTAMDTPRGMLFVWPSARTVAFFMRDTSVPLDLAYVRSDGSISSIHGLVPFDETPVGSGEPILAALEVPAGTLGARGVEVGDLVAIPQAVLDDAVE